MPEWLGGADWWRYTWGPLLAAGLVWLASVWNKKTDARVLRDARLDGRMDQELKRADAEIEDLRKREAAAVERADKVQAEADRWERVARRWFRHAHDLGHKLISARQAAVRALRVAGKRVPETWDEEPELPPLEDPWAMAAPAPLPPAPAGD